MLRMDEEAIGFLHDVKMFAEGDLLKIRVVLGDYTCEGVCPFISCLYAWGWCFARGERQE